MPQIYQLSPSDYQTTTWSGGTTTQLYLSPQTGDYLSRNFDFRLSTATVEATESDFTPLAGYHRLLMTLDQPIKLTNQTRQEHIRLDPFQPYAFDGGDHITSQGTCRDFNLIYKPSYQGHMTAISPEEILTSRCRYQFVYALCPINITVGSEGILSLGSHQLLIIEQTPQVHEMSLLFSPHQSGGRTIAIWTALS